MESRMWEPMPAEPATGKVNFQGNRIKRPSVWRVKLQTGVQSGGRRLRRAQRLTLNV